MNAPNVERLSERVIRHQSDGRRRFDPQAKAALIEACRQPGVSIAGLALEHGINANLLRKWVARAQLKNGSVASDPLPAFVPVLAYEAPAAPDTFPVRATLPNGVTLDLGPLCADAFASLLPLLARLPCSASKQG